MPHGTISDREFDKFVDSTNQFSLTNVVIVGGGTGYKVADVLTVAGGTASTAGTLTVSSVSATGVITGINLGTKGSYQVKPANPVSVTGGTGTGATFTLSYFAQVAVVVTNPDGTNIGGGAIGANINLDKVAGTTTSVNSGVADAGTVRVVSAANVATLQVGQAIIAVTGNQVALSATSQVLQNGVVISAWTGNNANAMRVGNTGVTFTGAPTGSGNGYILAPGAAIGIPSGVNLNTIFINGTLGDIVSFEGS